MANRLWKFLTTDIRELVSLDTVDGGKDTVEAVLGLAEALEESGPKVQQLAPLIGQLDSLLDVLNSPLAKIVEAGLPFVSIGTGLLKFYLKVTKEEPTVTQSVALVSQAAYLETVKAFLAKPKLKGWLAKVGDRPASASVQQKLKALGELEISDAEARQALLYFHESKLAETYGEVLISRLVALGVNPDKAAQVADKLARDTSRLMLPTLVKQGDSVKALVEWYRVGGDAVFEKYLSIDSYLAEMIAPCPHDQVFAEAFAFKDIYVPLKAQPLTTAGNVNRGKMSLTLEVWARSMLNNSTQKDQVMFVQGGPGRGKSVFCRMFADWVRRHEHPRWTPIFIRLRDVSILSRDFEETLAKAVDRDFAKTDSGWLTDRNVNFLFLLDGFDELLMEGRTSGGLDHFLDQVGRFQEQCARNSEKGHRVLITGRTLALQAIESRMPSNLARVEILPMDNGLQAQWFNRWDKLLQPAQLNFREILSDKRLPERVRELAREPLLLYLLAAMYRDDDLKPEMFAGAEGAKAEGAKAKVLIYERTLDWVLTKQRAEGYRCEVESTATVEARDLNPEITELTPEQLRRILQEAGLCVVQSGMEFASISAIEDRLSQDSAAKAFLEAAQKRLETDDTPLRNALAAFYLQEGRQGEGSIEFVHKSFSEFLCAERIVNSLIDVCQPGRNREYDIEDPVFCWAMYDLFGCHVLTLEIVEYLTALLIKHPEFQAERLHKRLYDFYWRWSEGEFIDAPPENLSQQKMRLLRHRAPDREERLGQRQVDMYTGLNAMILLFELHRHGLDLAQVETQPNSDAREPQERTQNTLSFHPCIRFSSADSDRDRLLEIIGVSHCIDHTVFTARIGPFLNNTDLSNTDLRSTDLSSVDLSSANLSSADLRSANLSSANLSSANLSNVDLRSANLRSANLRSTDLRSTDLRSADLRSANLRSTDLRSANLSNADLRSTDLRSADLRSTDFSSANLRSANLSSTDFSSANLSSTDLSSANLSSTDLSSANLSSTDLSSADLSSADLSRANLSRANLSRANLSKADLTGAILSDQYGEIWWNERTNWQSVKGLDRAIGVPEALKQQLGLTPHEPPEAQA
ncbi:MAG: pentapeptide repeat-containing protein [Cyanobacteria bacterium J06642_9]